MRTTLLGSLLDVAARQPRARRRGAWRSSSQAASISRLLAAAPSGRERPGGPLAGDFLGERAGAVSPSRIGSLPSRSARSVPRSGGAAASRSTSSPSRAVLEALAGAARRRARLRAGASEPFLHPGRAAAVVGSAGARLGWLGELHPLVCRDVGPRGRGRL